jgi:hypothetical protein
MKDVTLTVDGIHSRDEGEGKNGSEETHVDGCLGVDSERQLWFWSEMRIVVLE